MSEPIVKIHTRLFQVIFTTTHQLVIYHHHTKLPDRQTYMQIHTGCVAYFHTVIIETVIEKSFEKKKRER